MSELKLEGSEVPLARKFQDWIRLASRFDTAPGASLKKYQVDSIQVWDDFEHAGTRYAMGHLSCHAVMFKGEKLSPEFVVTYGLHCFTDDNSEYAIAFAYPDGRHERRVCLERYEASKKLRGLLEKLDQGAVIHQTRDERFFTMKMLNSATGKLELYKICLAFFHEHRLLRMHVTSAFFARRGEGVDFPVNRKGFNIFKIAMQTRSKPKGLCPKEVRNRHKKSPGQKQRSPLEEGISATEQRALR